MHEFIRNDNMDAFSLEQLQIFLLLFADDTALFSYSQEGLQNLLDKLHEYRNKWGIEVNVNKTVVMVFKPGNRPYNMHIKYNDHVLSQVKDFTYLGIKLTENGCFYQTQ